MTIPPDPDPAPMLERLWDAVPAGQPPVAEMVAVGGRQRRARRRALALSGVAAALVLGVGSALAVGGAEPRPPVGPTVSDHPPAADTTAVTVYYATDPDLGYAVPSLVRRVLEVADTGDPAYDALHALLTRPPAEPHFVTAFNGFHDLEGPGAAELTIDVVAVSRADGVVTVDLSRDPWDPYPMLDLQREVAPHLAVQQLVHTVQDALDTDAPVTLTVGGHPVRGVWMRRFDWPVAADPDVLPDTGASETGR